MLASASAEGTPTKAQCDQAKAFARSGSKFFKMTEAEKKAFKAKWPATQSVLQQCLKLELDRVLKKH